MYENVFAWTYLFHILTISGVTNLKFLPLKTKYYLLSYFLVLFQLFIAYGNAHWLLIIDILGKNDSVVSSSCSEIWLNVNFSCFNCNQENEGHFTNKCERLELLIFWCPAYKQNSVEYLIALWLYTYDINTNKKLGKLIFA